MRLVLATKDLTVAGRSFEGFPLLVGSDGWPVEPAQSFLWHILVESGEALSVLTWEAYGRRLFDYFAFLEANGLAWNPEEGGHSHEGEHAYHLPGDAFCDGDPPGGHWTH